MSIIDRFESGTFFGWTLKNNFSLFVQKKHSFQLQNHQIFHRDNPVDSTGFKFDIDVLDIDNFMTGVY